MGLGSRAGGPVDLGVGADVELALEFRDKVRTARAKGEALQSAPFQIGRAHV